MRILTVIELKSLPNIDEQELSILLPILKNKELVEFIKSCKGKTIISAEEMMKKFGINCHILFVKSAENETPRAIVVPLENQISGGGKVYSNQYKAYALDNGQTHFVKTFILDEESLPEYQNEVETLSAIGNLNGIIICAETKVHYLVATFVKGIDLEKYKNSMPANPDLKYFWKSLSLFVSASSKVKSFHKLELIHRDIKPGNIMIDVDNQCHLVDFGSSSSDKNPQPIWWGTCSYLAPELDKESDKVAYSQESDLYAFGQTFFEIFEKFDTAKFKLTLTKQYKYLLPLHKEINFCIAGLKSENVELRASCFTRITQLQRVPDNFKSKPEAYTYMIMLLSQWKDSYEDKKVLNETITAFKIAYENHEQNTNKVKELLNTLKGGANLLDPHLAMLAILIHAFDNIDKPQIGHDDILPRRFESDFACHVIQKPTTKMMAAIKQVSDAIIAILIEYKDYDTSTLEQKVIQEFLEKTVKSDILFGASKTKPTIEDIIEILTQNKPEDFIKVQHISFKFAQIALRQLPLHNLPTHEPSGTFLKILQRYQEKIASPEDSPLSFYLQMAAIKDSTLDKTGDGYKFRSFISDELIYSDEIFSTDATRGRQGSPNTDLKTNQVGLMKFEHAAHSKGLVTLPGQSWYADCKTQAADKESIHYTSALNTDCPYITGPSGMTSLFMNMFFILTNPKDSEAILSYSLAVMAYIVGAGYHSIKEVLIPMVKCINLLPNYPKYEGMEYLTAAPLYNHYFQALEQFDSEFAEIHEQIWQSHLEYFTNTFMPIAMRKNCTQPQLVEDAKVPAESQEMIAIVSHSVSLCIKGYISKDGFGFFAATTDQQTIALSILKDVCHQQLSLTSIFRHIQTYCVGTFYEENGLSISKKMQQAFIGFLFNSLKERPTFLSYLNLAMKISKTISVDSEVNACSEEFAEQRILIHQTIKNATINDEEIVDNSDDATNAGSKVMFAGWK
jgi:serine/threonine protein kinase